jgi:hypothetical protein
MNLEQAIFDLGAHIRYAAFGNGQTISTKQRDGVSAASAEGTDFYEELLVNPTLLRLATQRGELDCGGLRFPDRRLRQLQPSRRPRFANLARLGMR